MVLFEAQITGPVWAVADQTGQIVKQESKDEPVLGLKIGIGSLDKDIEITKLDIENFLKKQVEKQLRELVDIFGRKRCPPKL